MNKAEWRLSIESLFLMVILSYPVGELSAAKKLNALESRCQDTKGNKKATMV